MIDTNSEAFRAAVIAALQSSLDQMKAYGVTSLSPFSDYPPPLNVAKVFVERALTAYEAAKPSNDMSKLVFHNRESIPLNIVVETTHDSVPSIMAWYGAYYAGDPYTVTYDGRNVPIDLNGVPVNWSNR